MNSRSPSRDSPAIFSAPRHLLASLAPQLMSKHIFNNSFPASFSSSLLNSSTSATSSLDISRAFKLLLPPSLGGRSGISFNDLLITDPTQIDHLLALDLPSPPSPSLPSDLSLLDGFQASLSSSTESKNQRRRRRAEIGFQLLGFDPSDRAWPNSNSDNPPSHRRKSSTGPAERQRIKKKPVRRRKTDIIGLSKTHSTSHQTLDPLVIKEILPQLQSELDEIVRDQQHLHIRKQLVSSDLNQIDLKILELTQLKKHLEQSMLTLKEEELELIDEYEGVSDQLLALQEKLPLAHDKLSQPTAPPSQISSSTNSRWRRGPAYLPSEHDELPKNISFMTLRGHSQAIAALDFSSPYGYLVSSSLDESVQIWDLATGEPIQTLKAHNGAVKCLQVEEMTCITGGLDGQICIWDLDRAIESDSTLEPIAQDEQIIINGTTAINQSDHPPHDQKSSYQNACVMKLEGHSRSITALYFDDTCLVTGSSDKTIRQWDLNTGQAVMTMDILWAMQNPISTPNNSSTRHQLRKPSTAISDFEFGPELNTPHSKNWRSKSYRTSSSGSNVPNDAGIDSIQEPPSKAPFNYFDSISAGHEDCIGGIQFWGYALASGSGDGCVRMWDMRTGQAHRTLVGHTGPITCIQFDEIHLVSGSIDKSIKIWDLRTGAITETIRYNHSISALQFDSRKIISASGDANINVYNRITQQKTTISMNGHNDTVERLRYFDRYMVTGSKDTTIKVWSI